jgi:UDP-N-acetylmuramate: L-alanyl-gamma-D-glutamyl-meso-diaminopimelate ligase
LVLQGIKGEVMHIHILGICGTFMGGIALIAKNLGHKVTGSDFNVYPPMSTMLLDNGIEITNNYNEEQLNQGQDLIIVGNAMSRGNPCVEYMLDNDLPFMSGPEWLERYVLNTRKVIGVAGTHGKTSTSAMVAWILEKANLNPSFLIGGVTGNFNISARVTDSKYFVIESDEYDCAFFDKRSKFVHYRPFVQILNNLEYDHADIFENIDAIKKQFHHLVRIVPSKGEVLIPTDDKNLEDVIEKGCWSSLKRIGKGGELNYELIKDDGSEFKVLDANNNELGVVAWASIGLHNVKNALMAIVAANYIGVDYALAINALASFKMPKRRMELKGTVNDVDVYDDFAHHPTAIKTTLEGLRNKVGNRRIIAVFEPRSNTMKLGVNHELLKDSMVNADIVYMYAPSTLKWNTSELADANFHVCEDFDKMLTSIVNVANENDVILVMSNGGFNGIHGKLLDMLKNK